MFDEEFFTRMRAPAGDFADALRMGSPAEFDVQSREFSSRAYPASIHVSLDYRGPGGDFFPEVLFLDISYHVRDSRAVLQMDLCDANGAELRLIPDFPLDDADKADIDAWFSTATNELKEWANHGLAELGDLLPIAAARERSER